jgi:SAM-dependent methyltransferase
MTADYILGTHDEEIARLALQHDAWRDDALGAWSRAGIRTGQTVLDVGCGPGFATLDLAEVVGASGRIIAIDKSQRFLAALQAHRSTNVTTHLADLDAAEFPEVHADAAWCRWVLTFTTHPRDILGRIARSLRPGGTIALHEYFDYSTWRALPRCEPLERFVDAVMQSWRDAGGEPDIALALPGWLDDLGFQVRHLRPLIVAVHPGEMKWKWLRAFIEVNGPRLVDLGYLTAAESAAVNEATQCALMITPGVMEIVATGSC